MGKRRNTARTGDKAIYNSRQQQGRSSSSNKNKDKDDPMYNEIDRFHNERDSDFIRLGDDGGSDDGDDERALIGNKESVLDLGIGGDSSNEDEGDDEDDDDENSLEHHSRKKKDSDSEESDDSSIEGELEEEDDDDDDDQQNIEQDPRRWGKKKSLYYHGDTADLEIGQEKEDAFLEEEAAKEIQASRFEEMDEDDFVLSDDDNNKDAGTAVTKEEGNGSSEQLSTVRDPTKLPKKAARKLLHGCYPELLPMVSYFSDIVSDLKDRTQVATSALMDGAGTAESVGATIRGQEYLLTKSLMQKSIALNVVMYLLLRSASAGEDDEDATANIQAHPVMEQLKKFNSLLQKFEEDVHNKTEGIDNQLDNLVKAAALMAETGNVTSDDESDGSSEDEPDEVEQDNDIEEDRKKESSNSDQDEESVDEEISIGRVKQQEFQRTLNEARFGLRLGEAKEPSRAVQKRRIGDMDDFGDLEEEQSTSGSRLLASTVNTIEQRSQVASRKRRQAPLADALDDLDEYDDQVAQGIKMMEEELGKLDDDIEDGEKDNNAVEDMTDPDHHDDETSDFYNVIAQRNKTKKSFKKSLYQVAPKFPRTDNEVAGERAISKTILKNRGLVPHKAKINRNPRAKKRKQYDEAIKRRKGTVREVRRDEGHKYGGEGTGIKSGISRSRKLAIK